MRLTQKIVVLLILCFAFSLVKAQGKKEVKLSIDEGEYWWGGLSSLGHTMPYDQTTEFEWDLWGDNKGNQAQPLLLSSKGRFVWSESPIKYCFEKGQLTVTVREGEIITGQAGETLKSVYDFVSETYFPSNDKIPAEIMFTNPQYNTWIELMYEQNEEDILNYAQSIIDNGYPPGVLMIDDNWQEDYGTWQFSSKRFKDPKGMIEKLHKMGFKVMLWVCPFISPDSQIFRKLAEENKLLLAPDKKQNILWANTKNKAAAVRWWNGISACLDLSNLETRQWFQEQLDILVDEYGVDGFKFDAGDARFYKEGVVSKIEGTPNDHTTYFAEIGLQYPFNEYRASWKMAGLPLVQRLRDKNHHWEDLQKLVGDQMAQSVMGYAYTCPDMIGGGQYTSFLNLDEIDQELIVRSAQVHALMPMMQFSVSPWRVLSEENAQLCREAALLHESMGEHFVALAKKASKTGEPIVKPMALAFPEGGFEKVNDQFVLGNDIIVTPVLEKGMRSREVILPKGKWEGVDGKIYKGGKIIVVDAPLHVLPYFKKR
ncbi:glycoside hydrolase family 31 protein [Flammeovirga sp. EKP202]|uniref:glycoside hydrolase family 31 protein n=1 Tax=Flammeovirga sp. EKP202 TaxID=2770592 RepID=UPI00165F5160|nr:glycoside hydrolase family 31 protein [Flammeovirga sp. EKP202]MBD0401920.1 glycoside hydrolase [Flammeovirga sp. EKP202]